MNRKNVRRSILVAAMMLTAGAAYAGPGGGPAGGLALLVALGTGLTAFVVWGRSSFPHIAAASDRAVAGASAWKTFWVGLVNAVAAFLLIVLFGKLGQAFKPAGLLAVAVLATAAVVAFRGAMGIWPAYGTRVLGPDEAPSDLQASLAGGALLTGISLLFPVGLVFGAYVLLRSMGAGVLMHVSGPKPPPAATEPAAPSA